MKLSNSVCELMIMHNSSIKRTNMERQPQAYVFPRDSGEICFELFNADLFENKSESCVKEVGKEGQVCQFSGVIVTLDEGIVSLMNQDAGLYIDYFETETDWLNG